jgi:hypothetical protein
MYARSVVIPDERDKFGIFIRRDLLSVIIAIGEFGAVWFAASSRPVSIPNASASKLEEPILADCEDANSVYFPSIIFPKVAAPEMREPRTLPSEYTMKKGSPGGAVWVIEIGREARQSDTSGSMRLNSYGYEFSGRSGRTSWMTP